jgi:hypothetical protein
MKRTYREIKKNVQKLEYNKTYYFYHTCRNWKKRKKEKKTKQKTGIALGTPPYMFFSTWLLPGIILHEQPG